MKKLYFYICAVIMSITVAKAQQAVAVLTHEGTSKTFSGYNALQNAYKEAAHGDLITLSSGTFGAVETIEKAVKIRGAGMEADTVYHTSPTILVGDIILNIQDAGDNHFRLEGIYNNNVIYYMKDQSAPEFIKCRLNTITKGNYEELGQTYYGKVINAMIFHSRILGYIACTEGSTITCINSHIKNPYCYHETSSVFVLQNCVITGGNWSDDIRLYGSTLTNCVMAPIYTYHTTLNDKTIFNNCLLKSNLLPDKTKNTYQSFDNVLAVFKTYNGEHGQDHDAEDFMLNDEYNSKYGMYSGDFPYSPRLSGPHIQLMEVAPRTSDAGTLNVRIKVENTIE